MVDYFSLALTHGLIALALVRMVMRADLDRDPLPSDDAPDAVPAEEPAPAPTTSGVPRLKLPVRRA